MLLFSLVTIIIILKRQVVLARKLINIAYYVLHIF